MKDYGYNVDNGGDHKWFPKFGLLVIIVVVFILYIISK